MAGCNLSLTDSEDDARYRAVYIFQDYSVDTLYILAFGPSLDHLMYMLANRLRNCYPSKGSCFEIKVYAKKRARIFRRLRWVEEPIRVLDFFGGDGIERVDHLTAVKED